MPTSGDRDLGLLKVLIVDANSTYASIMREQLYAAGLPMVTCARDTMVARQMLEEGDFSAVVVSLETEQGAGQYLIDELRQSRVIKPATVVVYVTERPTYAKVMEAAETSADGCVVRPYKSSLLIGKLARAVERNARLADLFGAFEQGNTESVLLLAAHHIQRSPDLANYCSRLAVELLLQQERPKQALGVLQRLKGTQSLPWVQLATARAALLDGKRVQALKVLSGILEKNPGCGDAYDLLGRLQVEQGELKAALASMNAACAATPGCMIRTQHAGALAFFCGDQASARVLLSRARMIGFDSRLLDGLTLYLLGLLESDAGALAAMRAAREQLAEMALRDRASMRLQRMRRALDALYLFRSTGEVSQPLALLHKLAQEHSTADFRGEDCAVVMLAWSRLRVAPGRVAGDICGWVSFVGMRLVTGRGMLGYLGAAGALVPEAVAILEGCLARVIQHAQDAVDACADPARLNRVQSGLRGLFSTAQSLRNARLLDLCVLLAQQNRVSLGPEADSMIETARALSLRYGPGLRSISGIARGKRIPGTILPASVVRSSCSSESDTRRTNVDQLVTSTGPGELNSGFVDLWFDTR